MNGYRIECKTPGHDWRTLGSHRDDITWREYGMPAERLAEITIARLSAHDPESEYRAVPCEVTR